MRNINPEAIKYCMKAKELLDMKEMEGPALMTIRNSLESLIKYLCKMCSIDYDTRETDLSIMIDSLYNSGMITDSTRSLMHRTRQLCNKGAHVDEDISAADAVDAYKYMVEILRVVSEGLNEESVCAANDANNVPMEYPDYYSQDKRYYGKWANCYTRQSLLMIPEYVQLERKAAAGDVAACLDIARGFLPKNQEILWNDNQLINMPNYIHRGQAYNQAEAYDIRYYYWIMKAVMNAGWRINEKDFPMKYIATAIWEADLMWINHLSSPDYKFFISGISEYYDQNSRQYQYIPEYTNQYNMAAEMFRCDPDSFTADMMCYGLNDNICQIRRAVFEGLTECRIVAPVFEDAVRNPLFKLRFIEYCGKAFVNQVMNPEPGDMWVLTPENAEEINRDYMTLRNAVPGCIPESLHVSAGDLITWNILEPYTIGAFCNKYYCLARNNADICARRNVGKKQDGHGVLKSIRRLFSAG